MENNSVELKELTLSLNVVRLAGIKAHSLLWKHLVYKPERQYVAQW